MFPLELVTMLGSVVVGGILKVWGMSMQSKQQKDLAMLTLLDKEGKLFKEAREYEGKGFQWTRRVIALSVVFSVVVLPKLAAIFVFPVPEVTVGWTQFDPGSWFSSGRDVVEWKTMRGMVITPLDTHLMASIAGLYFGGSLIKGK